MKCPICHQEIRDNSKFCGKCGCKIPRCPTCGKVIGQRSRFCTQDGTPLPDEILSLFSNNQHEPIQTDFTAGIIEEIVGVVHDAATESIKESAASAVDGISAESVELKREKSITMAERQLTDTEPDEPIAESPAPVNARTRFCVQCGQPCEENQRLCIACQLRAEKNVNSRKRLSTDNDLIQRRSGAKRGDTDKNGHMIYGDNQSNERTDTIAPKKRNRIVPILAGIIFALIVALGAIVVYIAINGVSDSHMDNISDSMDAESLSKERTAADSGDGDSIATEPEIIYPDSEPYETEPQQTEETAAGNTESTVLETEPTYMYTYEVVKEDLSWEAAKSACEAKDGYLATITSQEEFDKICQLAAESGLTYIWLGACIQSDSDAWGAGSWVTGEAWTFDKWYPGEPSYADTDGTKEYCLCLWNVKYNGEDIGWTFNDQRNDLIGELPFLSGKIGYICEYAVQVNG